MRAPMLLCLALAAGCGSNITGDASDDTAAPDDTAGADGTDGADGADGTDGADGADGTDGTDGSDGTEVPVDCQTDWDPDFYGIIAADLVTATPYNRDAGLSAVKSRALGLSEGDSASVSLPVSGAVVTNVGEQEGGEYSITLGDGGAHILAFRVALPEAPEPGQVLSFTATRVKNYFGTPEIVDLESVSVSGSTSQVYVYDSYGAALDFDLQQATNVRLYGEVTAEDGGCGGDFQCYTVTHGLAEARVRTRQDLDPGDCVILTAPVSQFDDQTQLDLTNEGWMAVTAGG